MTGQNSRISPVGIERWLLGEENQEQRARVERALSAENRAQIRAMDQELRRALFKRVGPRAFAASVTHSAAKEAVVPRHRVLAIRVFAVPALAAIAFAIWAVPNWPKPDAAPKTERITTLADERAKGLKPRLMVYRKQGSRAELLSDGSSVKAGDILQIAYLSAGRRYGVVISIDGAGAVTLHAPADASQSSELIAGSGQHTLPLAYELDQAPAYERFFFIVSHKPIDPSAILSVARDFAKKSRNASQKPLPLAGEVEQYSLILVKNVF
jgi:hypothetical protein